VLKFAFDVTVLYLKSKETCLGPFLSEVKCQGGGRHLVSFTSNSEVREACNYFFSDQVNT
jgi:hypothetical protein